MKNIFLNYKKIFQVMSIAALFLSCTKNQIASSGDQNFYLNQIYINKSSTLRIFKVNEGKIEYITDLLPDDDGSVIVPKNILKTDEEDRTKKTNPFAANLILKIYNSEVRSNDNVKDFYFETQIFGQHLKVSNVTTALSWLLRFSTDQDLYFTETDFNEMVQIVELKCLDCRNLSNSGVVDYILKNNEIFSLLKNKLQINNPNFDLSTLNYNPPEYEYVNSSPVISKDDIAKIEISEDKKLQMNLLLTAIRNSDAKVYPDRWEKEFNSFVDHLNTPNIEYTTLFTDAGFHLFTPYLKNASLNYRFEVTVANKNRLPQCAFESIFHFNTNRLNEISLSQFCSDPDPEHTNILYNLISGPPGLTISTDGRVKWIVNQSHYDTKTTWTFKFGVTDPLLGYSEYSNQIELNPDARPTISFNSILQMTEGVDNTHLLSAVDPDGDPFILRAVSLNTIVNGLPLNSSVLSNFVRSGNAGNYDFTWNFMPSYLQTQGGDGTLKIKFVAYYDSSLDPNLDSSVALSELIVEFNLTNTNDPPIFVSQPLDFAATEGNPFVYDFADDAIDPNPNSTAVTYSLAPVSVPACDWDSSNFTVTQVSGFVRLTVNPEYKSARECNFRLQVTDQDGLSTLSSEFTIAITDTNQPVYTQGTAPTLITGTESQFVDLRINEMFADLDNDQNDESEIYSWECLLDQDQDSNYTDLCSSLGGLFNPALAIYVLNGRYMPNNLSAGSYFVKLRVTDKGGVQAEHNFRVDIADAPAPMDLLFSLNGVPDTDIVQIEENEVMNYSISSVPASVDLIDNYGFVIESATCTVIGGIGSCPTDLLTQSGGFSGSGSVEFMMQVKPSFVAADIDFPGTDKSYSYRFVIKKSDDPNLRTEKSILIKVTNKNRAPTVLTSAGCTNCSLDTTGEDIKISINAAADIKTGPNWGKTYKTTFQVTDLDVNDFLYTDFNPTSVTLGQITNNLEWSFKLPSCVNPHPSTSIVRTLVFRGSDSRGGSVDRPVKLTIQKANASSTCLN